MKSSRKSTKSFTKASKPAKSRSLVNASGYEKRIARKAQASRSTADIYEHVPEKARRSNITAELDRDEAWEYAAIDEASEEQRQNMRARLIGENDEDGEIASEDDEDLDSDAAFEESDEERFAGFFSSKVSP